MNRQDECLEKDAARGVESDEGGGKVAASIFAPAAAPRSCLQPVYMRRFVCDGRRCGSLCCCAKWGVALDAATLARYEGRPELLHELKKGLERSEATGGWIMRHENGRCVFLREDGLCSLHRRFGIGAISDVCAEYPRKMHEVGDTLDRALCLSCPVAAEEVLFAEEPLAFEWVEVAAPRPAYVDRMPLGAPLSAAAFRSLQLAGIALLAERRLSLDARLAALGLLLARAEAYVEQGEAEDLTRDAAAIADAAAGEAKALLAANPFDAALYQGFFQRLFPALAQATEDDLPETAAYLARIRRAFGEGDGDATSGRGDAEKKSVCAALAERRRRYGKRILSKHGNALENWLVNEFLLGRYPLTGGTSFLANYEVFVVLYKMLEFLLLADPAIDEGGASALQVTTDATEKDVESVGQDGRTKRSILAAAGWLAVRTNHFPGYIDALAEKIARLLPEDRLLSLLDGNF
ncbi:flagellin lysine-N-methylase [Selenomonas sputigena]|uniref:flagellin lysine-N-methylase n=1 Tax=Selenomonas sputigena TaxID=69823 RepID=UPI002231BD8D|nr:flagellin lysine-N-methylase [Selenomonas sputigena]UZD44447.1 flagellin lysine-N-methylase [Selenomonas sputigena]